MAVWLSCVAQIAIQSRRCREYRYEVVDDVNVIPSGYKDDVSWYTGRTCFVDPDCDLDLKNEVDGGWRCDANHRYIFFNSLSIIRVQEK